MNVHRSRILLVVLAAVLSGASPSRAGVPAGLGGLSWRSATPQSNTLHGVAAPIPNSGGVGLAAVGDASTLVYRQAPLGVGAAGWLCGRGRAIETQVQYRGVAILPSPARVAVAVNDGTVLIGDGCAMAPTTISQHALNAVAWAADGSTRRLAVAGDSGAAFTYDDFTGKFTPSVVDAAPGGPADIFAMSFPGAGLTGYAAGDVPGPTGPRGVLYKTTDGGQSWFYLADSPPSDAVLDVSFVSPSVGFALGSLNGTGIVLFTSNGGAAWQPVAVVDGTMRAIAAFDAFHIVLVGGNGILVATDGATFIPRPEPIEGLTRPLALEDVDVAGPEAWAVGEGGVIFTSRDEGNTWTPFADVPTIDQASLQDYYAMRFLSDTTVVAAGTNGAVLKSVDGGATFKPTGGASNDTVYAIGAPGARNAGIGTDSTGPFLAAGARHTIAQIDPSGGVATLIGSVPKVDYHAVAAIGGAAGAKAWAVGEGGTIIFSDADSPVWNVQPSGVTAGLNAVQVLELGAGGLNLLTCGDGGTVLRSTDGLHWGPAATGGSLTPLPAPFTATNLHGLAFRTAQAGFVVGDAGVLAHTVDGGRAWDVQQPVPSAAVLAASILPPSFSPIEAWAVGEHQTVLHSADGGQTWQVLPPPVPGLPGGPPPDFAYRAVQGVAYGVAFIAGEEGHLLRTTDAGGSWTELGGTVADTFRSLRMISPTVGIASSSSLFAGSGVTLTTEGWLNSATATLPTPPGLIYGVDRLNGEAFAVGAAGFVARSVSLSNTASPDFALESGDVRAVASPQPGQYVAAGDGGLLMRSVNGGSTWQRTPFANPFGPNVQLRALAFGVADPTGLSPGYAAGGLPGGGVPVLFRTLDSGQTWTPVNIGAGPSGASLNALAVFSNRALAAAANGVVFAYDGKQWSAQRPVPGFAEGWNALSATDGRWYVAGDRGMAARFPDPSGNPVWWPMNSGTSLDLLAVAGPPYPSGSGGNGTGGGIESLRDDIRGYCTDPGGILFTDTGGLPLFGNVSRTGAASAFDVRMVLAVAAGLVMPTPDAYFYGDVAPPAIAANALPGDGVLDLRDAARIMRIVMGL